MLIFQKINMPKTKRNLTLQKWLLDVNDEFLVLNEDKVRCLACKIDVSDPLDLK